MRKTLSLLISLLMAITLVSGCGKSDNNTLSGDDFDNNKSINVVSREDGSGTRGAFTELFKIEQSMGERRKDLTTKEAIISNKTDVMLTNIANDANAIGYVSLGSLNNSVKAVAIDGVKASGENVQNGSYKISRPFNIVTNGQTEELVEDFIIFILSAEGQAVIAKGGYIAINDKAAPYSGKKPLGKITVAGSSSVAPIMEKLKEAYVKINPDATIEIQMSDSTAGITGAIEGTFDIGMASRGLKDSEKQKLTTTTIAFDGIVVIVNPKNSVSQMSSEDVKNIFTGKILKWNEIIKN